MELGLDASPTQAASQPRVKRRFTEGAEGEPDRVRRLYDLLASLLALREAAGTTVL